MHQWGIFYCEKEDKQKHTGCRFKSIRSGLTLSDVLLHSVTLQFILRSTQSNALLEMMTCSGIYHRQKRLVNFILGVVYLLTSAQSNVAVCVGFGTSQGNVFYMLMLVM